MKKVLKAKSFQAAIGIGISVLLLIWVFQMVDIAVVWEQMLAADPFIFLVALPVFFLHYILRALRWRYLLLHGEETSLRNLFDAIMVGALANFLLPLRAGEFVRPYMLSKTEEKISFHSGFLSVVTERFFDLSAVLLTFSLVVSSQPGLPEWVRTGAYALAVLAVALFLYIISASLFPKTITSVSSFFIGFLPEKLSQPLLAVLDEILESTRILARPRNVIALIILTVLVWLSCYLLFYVFLYLLPVPRSPLLATTVAVIIALAVAAPSAPGFLGVYQTACFAAFALFSIGEELSVSYSVLTHIFQYVVFVGYGFYALWRSGISFSDISTRSQSSVSVPDKQT